MDSPEMNIFNLDGIKDTIILDHCLDALSKFPANSIDFIFTSPPYANNRKKPYAGYSINGYVKWFLEISAQLNRVLKSDGSFILNIKERAMNG
jgi:DNA modification methylase